MAKARVFKSGNSLAVRLPKAFRVQSRELEISRRGDEIVLREPSKGLRRAFDLLIALPEDAVEDIRDRRPPQERDGL
ncbi:antitoxin [Ferrovibrio sp.]|uniref:antitoxin n=1 Tax=Ferrovibrio sp. TaxID=1917215 RepID=UPI003D2AEE71